MDAAAVRRQDRLELLRALLLLQGAVLVTTTAEAALFGVAFAGAPGGAFWLTALATIAVFAARTRVGSPGRRPRRLLYAVEGLLVATTAIDAILALALTQALPPPIPLLTRLVLPLAVVVLLRRTAIR